MNNGIVRKKNFSAVILAAGNASRIGKPKALLPYDPNNTFLEKLIGEYVATGISPIVVVVNETVLHYAERMIAQKQWKEKVNVKLNRQPGQGRFFSILLGLNEFKRTPSVCARSGESFSQEQYCFLQNVDNPFTNAALLKKMMRACLPNSQATRRVKNGNVYLVPSWRGRIGHPLLVSQEAGNHIVKMNVHDGDLRVALKPFARLVVAAADENILVNINTLEDYEKHFTYTHGNRWTSRLR